MGTSCLNASTSVPPIPDKIRASANQAKTQTGCGVGEEDYLSFTHSNLRRACLPIDGGRRQCFDLANCEVKTQPRWKKGGAWAAWAYGGG